MEYRPLGRTGIDVSVLGFGCGDVGGLIVKGTLAERKRAVARAVELGVNYFDTAPLYGDGQSEASIGRALRDIEAAILRGEGAINEDFAFHRAIAEASGNPRFAQLLEFLGRHVIPRQSVRVSIGTPRAQRQYLVGIQKEHGRIYEAIRAGQSAEARKAMRTHLTRSLRPGARACVAGWPYAPRCWSLPVARPAYSIRRGRSRRRSASS